MPRTKPVHISKKLSKAIAELHFSPPITHVYNPLEYAWDSYAMYLDKYAVDTPRQVLLLGMNPGPWGMVQTGVPFGDVAMVREWLGVEAKIGKPQNEHPKRPVVGFDCVRSEVSGKRLWGWAQTRFGTPQKFFSQFYVHNYCPLCFMEASGRNFTPDKLPASEAEPLLKLCDAALREMILYLQPEYLIGVGAFAESRLRCAAPAGYKGRIGRVLHPSPASPIANRGWAKMAEQQLIDLGVPIPH